MGSIPGSGRCPGEGNGNPLQYSCLENSMDRGAWWGCKRLGHVQQLNNNNLQAQTYKLVGGGLECTIKLQH